jgi:NitT/TauT family transport system permease protein
MATAGVTSRAAAPGGQADRPFVRRLPIEILSLLAGCLVWELAGRTLGLPWVPPLSVVLSEFAVLLADGSVRDDILSSLGGLALGFSISLGVGLVLGALMGRYRSVESALDVYVNALLGAPTIIFIPVFFAIFGISDWTRIAVIIVYSVFIIIVNTMTGIKTVDPALIEMAQSFGASERFIIRRILFPGSLPLVMAGIRLGLGRAVKGMINGEMIITFVGLGALAALYGSQFDMAKVFAVSVIVLVLALVGNWVVQAVDRRLTAWTD